MARSIAIMFLFVLSLVGIPGLASAADNAGSESGFCGPRLATNFLRPLEKLPPIRQVPRSGKLPFAPKALRLEVIGGDLAVGGGEIGFGFSDEAIGQVRRLDWVVSAELSEVGYAAATTSSHREKRVRLGSLPGDRIPSLLFKVPGAPAIYRVDIRIARAGSSQVLGEFSNYVRVVKPRFDTKLLSSSRVVYGGEGLSIRLANFGSESVSSIPPDWQISVQRFDGQGWLIAPSSPPQRKEHPVIRKLAPGRMGPCIKFAIPEDEDPGRYRFVMVVERSLRKGPERSVQLTSEFEIRDQSVK